MNDDCPALLMDLPTSIRGFCFLDDDGEPRIVLNSRLTHEQNMKTWLHERGHIIREELTDLNYHEYGGEM